MGKNKKKKGMKMPARVEQPVTHAKTAPTRAKEIKDNCTHWNPKKHTCKLGGPYCNNCQAYHQ